MQSIAITEHSKEGQVTRKPILFATLLTLTSSAICAQQPATFTVPVKCGVTHDSPNPSRPPAAHPLRITIPEAEANAIDQAGRNHPGFLSIPEPENFGMVRYRIAEYADCANPSRCYWNDLQSQLDRAQAELKRLVATRKPGERLAMVLDIDETSLSSYCELKREGFGYIDAQHKQWLVSPEASIAIPGTLELFNQALGANVSVFFITGRSHDEYEATAHNLRLAGYHDWTGLIVRNEEELSMDTSLYKSSHRAEIAKDHRIILSVGDQWSDLNGTPHAEVSIKLPNPFYFLP